MYSNEKKGCLVSLLKIVMPSRKLGTTVRTESLPYLLRDDFISHAEGSFYRVLNELVKEDYLICPKVSLKEIFFVSRPNENMVFYNKIDRKHIDFLLCDAITLKPAMGIELDDSTHKRPDRIERDEFVEKVFDCAGLRLLRVPVKAAYSTRDLRELIYTGVEAVKENISDEKRSKGSIPLCPKCGVEMVLRTATRGAQKGKKFFGCPSYPKCRELLPAYPNLGHPT